MPAAVAVRPLNVATLSNEKKIEEALLRSAPLFGSGMMRQVQALVSPVNIGVTVGTLAMWAVAHLYGVGEAFDLLTLAVGVGFMGWGFWNGFKKLVDFAVTAVTAKSEEDLNRAAVLFRDAAIQLGINTLLALLLKKPLTGALSKPGRITEINLRPGLRAVATPQAGKGITVEYLGQEDMMVKGKVVAGKTDSYGNIKVLKSLPIREQMKAYWHEEFHSAASPKSQLLRQYRAQLHDSLYHRMVFLRYLEEAGAEGYSLFREKIAFKGVEQGFGQLTLKAMRFPLKDEMYAILRDVETSSEKTAAISGAAPVQGHIIGSIIVEGHIYNVYIRHGKPVNHEQQK